MLPYELGHLYHAFVDMSGGKDDAVLCIGHEENGRVIPDRIEQQAGDAKPFNPRQAAVKFAALLREYRLSSVMGDAYAGNTFKADFESMGISYTICPWTKSDLYSALEPAINAGEVELPDIPKLIEQLLCLVTRGAKIDHEPNGHDDWANAVAGLVWKIRRATLTDAVICAPFIAEGVPRNVPGGVIGVGYLPTPVLAAQQRQQRQHRSPRRRARKLNSPRRKSNCRPLATHASTAATRRRPCSGRRKIRHGAVSSIRPATSAPMATASKSAPPGRRPAAGSEGKPYDRERR